MLTHQPPWSSQRLCEGQTGMGVSARGAGARVAWRSASSRLRVQRREAGTGSHAGAFQKPPARLFPVSAPHGAGGHRPPAGPF